MTDSGTILTFIIVSFWACQSFSKSLAIDGVWAIASRGTVVAVAARRTIKMDFKVLLFLLPHARCGARRGSPIRPVPGARWADRTDPPDL